MEGRGTRRAIAPLLCALVVTACGETPAEPEAFAIDGTWQRTEAGSETTIRFAEDGTFHRVAADLAGSSCASSSGTWRRDDATLTISLTTIVNEPVNFTEQYALTLDAATLELTGAASAGTYTRAMSLPSCVDYGFGIWDGDFTADIDGVAVVFSVVDVVIDVEGGSATIAGEDLGCASCPDGRREILLRIDSQPDPLSSGTFTVNNDPGATSTFYALYHPDPESASFIGFDTTRLAPPGTFGLSAIGPERIAATFDFRANPRVEGQTGPSGETSALVESGVVDLTYR